MSHSKINNSSCSNSNIYSSINETTNGISKSFIQPKITSTPLIKRDSIFATPPKQTLLSPRRYSLSEVATPPRLSRRDFTKTIAAGPLLASTRYNVNVSTYEDTKSPGLAGRIVQYNEEAERNKERSRPPTHQAKYGSPGLFPVVHLFKKKLPSLDQKSKRVTIRISSPEYSRFHTQEYNRKLLEGIIKPSSPINRGNPNSPSQSGSSTRSVLDALKEISRKRIHATEEYDLNEDVGKRLKTMNNCESNKRLRDESSPDGKSSSPTKPTSKKICMYDEYAASCSSTDFSFNAGERTEPKRKSISSSTLTENPKESKQIKLINAETQTVTNETTENSQSVEAPSKSKDPKETQSHSDGEMKEKSPLKIFDDAPLERIRKNRLAVLIGSLGNNHPEILPKPDYATVLNSSDNNISDTVDTITAEVPKLTDKPLVSILSSPKKSTPTKSSKHVHFSVPESISQTNLDSSSVFSFPTTTTTLVTTAVSSESQTKLSFSSPSVTTRETPAPPSSPIGLAQSSTETTTTTTLPVIAFGNPSESNLSSTTLIVPKSSSNLAPVETSKTNLMTANFQFKPTTVSSPPTVSVPSSRVLNFSPATSKPTAPASTSPPKMGGFKFDLSKPVTTGSNTPTFSFNSTTRLNTVGTTTNSNFGNPPSLALNTQGGKSSTFSFGVKTSTPVTNATTSFTTSSSLGSTSMVPSLSSSTTTITSPTPTFKFGAPSSEIKPAISTGFPLAQSNSTVFGSTSTTPLAPSFGANSSTSSVAVTSTIAATSAPSFNTNKTPLFSFGSPKTTSVPSTFGLPTSVTPLVAFGAPKTSSNFGSGANNFLTKSSSLPTSGFAVTTSSTLSGGAFAPSTTSNATFGSNPSTTFDPNKAVIPFGVSTTTSSSPFGKMSTPQFGQNTTGQSTFGVPTTTISFGNSNTFGSTAITTASATFGTASSSTSMFGAKTSSFGTPANGSNIFGGTVNTQPSGFGTSASKPAFGSEIVSPFGTPTKTTTAPSFGDSTTPSFNFAAKTTASSSFGSGNSFGTNTTASTGFVTTSTSAFGSSNSFGGTSNFGSANNAFGASTTPAFGNSTTSTQPSGFGVTNTASFGTASSGFNSGDKNSMFTNSSAFGSNPSPFGSTPTPSSGFGTVNNTSGFGTNNAVSAFAKPQTPQNTFGAPPSNTFGTNNSFGTAPTQPQAPSFGSANSSNTQNAVFNFGATAMPKPPGVFSFGGGSNEVPKPTFNFSGGSNAPPPAFGSAGAPSFGGSSSTPFVASGIPQFNTQPAAQGMFSIGSGSSTGKARTHLKPKRRT